MDEEIGHVAGIDRFGEKLRCIKCEGCNIQLQMMRYNEVSDRYVRGLTDLSCDFWLEYHCVDCGYYKGLMLHDGHFPEPIQDGCNEHPLEGW